jgi:hypothetical protein
MIGSVSPRFFLEQVFLEPEKSGCLRKMRIIDESRGLFEVERSVPSRPPANPCQIASPVRGGQEVDPGSLLTKGPAMEILFDPFYRPDRCSTE